MSQALAQELESALQLIRESIRARRPLNRYHARAVLLPLGELLRRREDARAQLDAARETIDRDRLGWDAAVSDEMELAVFEHLCSADPSQVGRPDYDMAYTREARERLEARLIAHRALGGVADESWTQKIAHADAILAPHQRER